MSGELAGKIGLVTGASSGIGRATAIAMVAAGASVVVAARRGPELASLVDEIIRSGGNSLAVPTDVTDETAVRAMVEACVAEYGQLDFAFNNAGIEGPSQPISAYTLDEFQSVLAVNTVGTFSCMKYELAQMQSQGHGVIVNDASVAGLRGMFRQSAYTASKHAVIGMTKVAALEYGSKGIRVNAVCPGFTKTDMVDRLAQHDTEREARLASYSPMKRLGTVEEVAAAVVWLCSDASSFTNGEALVLDGGLSV
ncbi:MAG: glucose 1-dehydrogenase [Chloroflexi bacterium]|nr:glucose 1-dehydrogenase [Chloroflexota bacterium]